MAETFSVEIDDVMSNMTEQMSDGLAKIVSLSKMLDSVIGAIGNETEQTMTRLALLHTMDDPVGVGIERTVAPRAFVNLLQTMDDPASEAGDNTPGEAADEAGELGEVGETIKNVIVTLVSDANSTAKLRAVLDALIDSMMVQVGIKFDKFLDGIEP